MSETYIKNKVIGFRTNPNFPLSSKEVREMVEEIIPLFISMKKGDVENYLKYNPKIKKYLDLLFQYKKDMGDIE